MFFFQHTFLAYSVVLVKRHQGTIVEVLEYRTTAFRTLLLLMQKKDFHQLNTEKELAEFYHKSLFLINFTCVF